MLSCLCFCIHDFFALTGEQIRHAEPRCRLLACSPFMRYMSYIQYTMTASGRNVVRSSTRGLQYEPNKEDYLTVTVITHAGHQQRKLDGKDSHDLYDNWTFMISGGGTACCRTKASNSACHTPLHTRIVLTPWEDSQGCVSRGSRVFASRLFRSVMQCDLLFNSSEFETYSSILDNQVQQDRYYRCCFAPSREV